MKTEHVLVTGLSASGKSTLAKYFRARGKNAYDTDKILGRYVSKKTGRPKTPTETDWKLMRSVVWRWNGRALRRLLNRHREVYLFGAADNTYEFIRLFDRAYYLHASKRLILKRLMDKSRQNDFGRSSVQRRAIINWIKPVARRARKMGLIFIDAALPLRQKYIIICTGSREKAQR